MSSNEDGQSGESAVPPEGNDPIMAWALDEALGGDEPPDLVAGVQARLADEPTRDSRHSRWLAAAVLLCGTLVVLGVAWAKRSWPSTGTADGAVVTTQEPAVADPAPAFVTDVATASALPADTLAVEVVGGDDAVIAALSRLRELQLLRVREPWNESFGLGLKMVAPSTPRHVTAASWPVLLGFPKLRRLELSGAIRVGRVDAAQVTAIAAALEALPLLTSLTLRCLDTDDAFVAALARARSLRELDLSFNHGFGEAGALALRGCVALRRLSLRGCQQLHDRELAPVASLPGLEDLDLSAIDGINWRNGSEPEDQIEREARLQSRRRADRIGMGPGEATFAALGTSPRLRRLAVSGSYWLSSQLALLGGDGASRLQELDVSGGQMDGVGFVAGLPPQLETLALLGDYGDSLLLAIAEHRPNLRCLRVPACDRITDRGIAALAGMKHLRVLDLRQLRGVTAASIDTLLGMPWLEELDVRHGPLGDAGVRQRLFSLPRLRILDCEPVSR